MWCPPKLEDFTPKTIAFYISVSVEEIDYVINVVDVCYEPVNETTSFVVSNEGILIEISPSFWAMVEGMVTERISKQN
jgi:hypothetical protein